AGSTGDGAGEIPRTLGLNTLVAPSGRDSRPGAQAGAQAPRADQPAPEGGHVVPGLVVPTIRRGAPHCQAGGSGSPGSVLALGLAGTVFLVRRRRR
ncbi:MAG TPA: MYXO-CTERM sorting domain-containing protein, partial [Polyangiales bacterium]|nr:MYXO-CTERM sorting domain-containing protein [Polyangiales bacterium]